MNHDDLFILKKRRFGTETIPKDAGGDESASPERLQRRYDAGASVGTMNRGDLPEEMDRRESVLNARIAEFENLVRKTKFSTAERLEKLAGDEKRWAEKWDSLQEAIDSLTARETDLARRESILHAQSAKLAEREGLLRQSEEEFQTRSERILQKITEQKEELQELISVHLVGGRS